MFSKHANSPVVCRNAKHLAELAVITGELLELFARRANIYENFDAYQVNKEQQQANRTKATLQKHIFLLKALRKVLKDKDGPQSNLTAMFR